MSDKAEYLEAENAMLRQKLEVFKTMVEDTQEMRFFDIKRLKTEVEQLEAERNDYNRLYRVYVDKFTEAVGERNTKERQIEQLEADKAELIQLVHALTKIYNATSDRMRLRSEEYRMFKRIAREKCGSKMFGVIAMEYNQQVTKLREDAQKPAIPPLIQK